MIPYARFTVGVACSDHFSVNTRDRISIISPLALLWLGDGIIYCHVYAGAASLRTPPRMGKQPRDATHRFYCVKIPARPQVIN